jgi:hypothetical protein
MSIHMPLSTLVEMHVQVEKLFSQWDALPKPWSPEQWQLRHDMTIPRSYLKTYVGLALAGESMEIVSPDVKTSGE